MTRQLTDVSSPEALGRRSVEGPMRAILTCPYTYGSAEWHRWQVARDEALGNKRGLHRTNAGEGKQWGKSFNYDTDSREVA